MVSSPDLSFDPREMLPVAEGHQPVEAHLDQTFVVDEPAKFDLHPGHLGPRVRGLEHCERGPQLVGITEGQPEGSSDLGL